LTAADPPTITDPPVNVTPAGGETKLKLTAPVKPSFGVMVATVVAEVPGTPLLEVELRVSIKLGAAVLILLELHAVSMANRRRKDNEDKSFFTRALSKR